MRYIFSLLLFCACWIGTTPQLFAASENGVIISEVHMNPVGTDTGNEYVELYNSSHDAVDVSHWDLDADSLPYFTLPAGTVIDSGEILTIYLRADGIDSEYSLFTGAGFGSANIRNTGGMVALFTSTLHSENTIVDYVQYGTGSGEHVEIAHSAGIWNAEDYISMTVSEGYSIQRICSGQSSECYVTDSATPLETLLSDEDNSVDVVELDIFINGELFEGDKYEAQESVMLSVSTGSTMSGLLLQTWLNGEHITYVDPLYFEEQGEYELVVEYGELQRSLSIHIVYNEKPVFQITEVLFSGENGSDYIEIWIENAGSLEGKYLEDYALRIDGVSYTLDSVVAVSGSYFLLTYGDPPTMNMEQDVPTFFMEGAGLVATTEQVYLIYKEQDVVAGVCWESGNIPSQEQDEYVWFTEVTGIWSGPCFDAHTVPKGKSIQRFHSKESPVSRDNYIVIDTLTPGEDVSNFIFTPVAYINIQGAGQREGNAPFSFNVIGDYTASTPIVSHTWYVGEETYQVQNPAAHIFQHPGTYVVRYLIVDTLGYESEATVNVIVHDPHDLLDQDESPLNNCSSSDVHFVRINEILPNPEGSDTHQEWIELYNGKDREVSLCGVFLDDEEGGSSPYDLSPYVMQPYSFLVLSSTVTKISLGNTKDQVRLLKGGVVIDMVTYEKAPEGKSYSMFLQ